MNSGQRTAVSPVPPAQGMWAVAVAHIVSFMGIGLIDPSGWPLSHRHRHPPASSR